MSLRYLVFPFLLLLFACQDKNGGKRINPSSGRINSMSVIISDPLWNGSVGDSLRKKFANSVDGLPQEEPLFTINQYPIRFLDGFKSVSRNIIIVKEQNKSAFTITKNEFALPQTVVTISGRNTDEIISHIEENADSIISTFKHGEILVSQENMRAAKLDDKKIRKKFGISLLLPSSYKYALKRKNFIWLKKEILSGSTSILIYKVPLSALKREAVPVNNIIRLRDSIGSLYIHGKVRYSRMITEESYSPYFFSTRLDGKKAYETKGTWELKNDFMNGPFINYAIMDPKHRRAIIIEGFCYAPSTEKRDLMLELEAIIRSMKTIK